LKKPRILFVVFILMAFLFSCGEKREANQKTDADVQVKVLATVNDVPITEYDVKQSLKRGVGHGEGVNPEAAQNVLQTLVRNELIYQKSVELGLDKNQAYRKKFNEVQAQLRAFQRHEMSSLYLNYVRSKVEVTDPDVQAYFEKNAKRIQTKYHVWQIFYKGNYPGIAKDYEDLKKGMPFEKVVSRRFPNLPKGMKAPWDMGFLYWSQIPPYWQDIVDRLKPGQTSEIIKGPSDRYWVIKLVNKEVDPKITFATEKQRIVEILRKQKSDELYDKMLSEMKAKAKIVLPQ
jgi:peptidyl-prolyl cis-trans isomerase C